MVTVNVSRIGSNYPTDREYATIQDWEAATDNDLVGSDVQEVGELYDDSDFTVSSEVLFSGATVDATRNRILRAASGHEYDPITDTGVWIIMSGGGALRIGENYFTLGRGIGCEQVDATTIARRSIRVNAGLTGVRLDGIYGENISHLTGGSGATIFTLEGPCIVTNCIARGAGGGNVGATVGYSLGGFAEVYNCIAIDILEAASTGRGFSGNATNKTCKNCIAMNCGSEDFYLIFGGTFERNASSDATAPGDGSLINQTDTDLFVDPANNDFTPKAGSNLIDAGQELSTIFTTDIEGTTRTNPWEIGPYDVVIPAPLLEQTIINAN